MMNDESFRFIHNTSFPIHHSNERFSVAFTEQVGIPAIAADTY
jgi:hypothetical protein